MGSIPGAGAKNKGDRICVPLCSWHLLRQRTHPRERSEAGWGSHLRRRATPTCEAVASRKILAKARFPLINKRGTHLRSPLFLAFASSKNPSPRTKRSGMGFASSVKSNARLRGGGEPKDSREVEIPVD